MTTTLGAPYLPESHPRRCGRKHHPPQHRVPHIYRSLIPGDVGGSIIPHNTGCPISTGVSSREMWEEASSPTTPGAPYLPESHPGRCGRKHHPPQHWVPHIYRSLIPGDVGGSIIPHSTGCPISTGVSSREMWDTTKVPTSAIQALRSAATTVISAASRTDAGR